MKISDYIKLDKHTPVRCMFILLGSAVLAFGLYNVHSVSQITEGGSLGLNLLLDNWFGISPAITNAAVSIICFFIGFKTLGLDFIVFSGVGVAGFSIFYSIFEQFDPIYPQIADMPLAASIAGAIFVGVGTGLCVRNGVALSGDDALAMSINNVTKIKIERIYMFSDISVLLLSLTYIPLKKILFSVVSVILSGLIIGFIQRFGTKGEKQLSEK